VGKWRSTFFATFGDDDDDDNKRPGASEKPHVQEIGRIVKSGKKKKKKDGLSLQLFKGYRNILVRRKSQT
jgi:hypothetical protein